MAGWPIGARISICLKQRWECSGRSRTGRSQGPSKRGLHQNLFITTTTTLGTSGAEPPSEQDDQQHDYIVLRSTWSANSMGTLHSSPQSDRNHDRYDRQRSILSAPRSRSCASCSTSARAITSYSKLASSVYWPVPRMQKLNAANESTEGALGLLMRVDR